MEKNTYRILTLSGVYKIINDPDSDGVERGFAKAIPENTRTIIVPGMMSQERINYDYSYSSVYPDYHGFVWYYRNFQGLPCTEKERCILEFERAGYLADVWVNGKYLGSHRHHEEAFSFDITDAVKAGEENLLAVRCFEPMRDGKPIEGIRLRDIPNGSLAEGEGQGPQANCIGGIISEVRIKIVPTVYITDQYVSQDYKTGDITVTVTAINAATDPEEKDITLLLTEQKSGLCVTKVTKRVVLVPGENQTIISCTVPAHKLWDFKNPFLYNAHVTVGEDGHTTRFGFRELKVENGYFTLNGTRFLLKCAHGNFSAATCIALKAMGFNAYRSIHRTMAPEVMDLCDELGFLIIESPITSWGMREHENTYSMIEAYMKNMVKLHRNHPSVGAYYFYNESYSKALVQMAIKLLPELRSMDPHNMFLLSSGRWDDELSVYSASNPGSDTFDVPMGGEGMENFTEKWTDGFTGMSVHDAPMGDLHPYAAYPLNADTRNWFRTIGQHSHPVFLSESGIGSQCDPVGGTLNAEALYVGRHGFPENCPYPEERVAWVLGMPPRKLWENTEDFLNFYDLRDLYPYADLLCAESDSLNGRQREQMFDLLRSNPHINGFSLTSFGGGNEGMCEGTALGNFIIKNGLAHVLQEGMAPLRFSLFAADRVVYAGKEIELEAVLCNEDWLAPGRYPMTLCVDEESPRRLIKKWDTEAVYPEAPDGEFAPLAATVFRGKISLPEEGEYHFRARLLKGDKPCAGNLPIRAVRIPEHQLDGYRIACVGLEEKVAAFLINQGGNLLTLKEAADTDLIMVGGNVTDKEWENIVNMVNSGATAIFLEEILFRNHPTWLCAIAGENARSSTPYHWLYHHDCIHIDHPVFENMTPAGFCDLESYGELWPKVLFENINKPSLSIAVSFRIEGALSAGLTFGEFALGKGKAVVQSFRLCEALGLNPLADRMLLNIVRTYTDINNI